MYIIYLLHFYTFTLNKINFNKLRQKQKTIIIVFQCKYPKALVPNTIAHIKTDLKTVKQTDTVN